MKTLRHTPVTPPNGVFLCAVLAIMLVGILECPPIWAQGPLTLKAIELSEAGNLTEAEAVLKEAVSGTEGNDPMTWYVQAFVLKEHFIQDGRLPTDPRRSMALQSVRECIQRDANNRLEKWWRPLLVFLGESYLADVQLEIRNLAPDQPVLAEQYFSAYADIQQDLDPDVDTAAEWELMQQQLGETAMTEARELERNGAGPWFALGTHHYTLATTQNHDQYRSYFNLAVHTYNQGVREFKAAEDNLDAIDSALADASQHWLNASRLLESAIAQDGTQTEGFEALAIVSNALLNQDRIEWCKAHIKELEGE